MVFNVLPPYLTGFFAAVMVGVGPGFFIRDGIVVIVKNADIPVGTVI